MKKPIFLCTLAVAVLIVAYDLLPRTIDSDFDIKTFSELPVQVGGRITPLDSVARNTLLILSARQRVVTPEGESLSPIEWFMDLNMRPEVADAYRVFKIENPDELGIAGLAETGQRYYAFNDLVPYLAEITRLFRGIDPEPRQRSAYEKQIAELYSGLIRYHRVMRSFHPVGTPERMDRLTDEYEAYLALAEPALQALHRRHSGEDYDAAALNRFMAFSDDYSELSRTAHLRVVPPPPPVDPMDDWKNVGLELVDVMKGNALSPYVMDYSRLTTAYRSGDAETFNATVAEMRERFRADFPGQTGRVTFERVYNGVQPFSLSMQLYVFVFLVVCISWLRWPAELGRAAFWILALAFAIHTLGLLARMYIHARPPVTNLYSSAVFVGWGAVFLGVLVEKFHKNGVGAAMASLVGFSTLIVAHHLAMSGDTFEMMRAVLDSNFWLATHVVVITFGYSAMFLAGALGIVFVLLGLFGRRFDKAAARSIGGMVYGVICFGAFFSLVGTILGGIWADQSWGRFWGWDPKENGALMVVISGALYLHARWGGIFRERGLMALAIFGNIVTAWSWFGTNLLGIGLHSYGFTDGGFFWLSGFVLSQLLFIGLALLPWRFWNSPFGRERFSRKSQYGMAVD